MLDESWRDWPWQLVAMARWAGTVQIAYVMRQRAGAYAIRVQIAPNAPLHWTDLTGGPPPGSRYITWAVALDAVGAALVAAAPLALLAGGQCVRQDDPPPDSGSPTP